MFQMKEGYNSIELVVFGGSVLPTASIDGLLIDRGGK